VLYIAISSGIHADMDPEEGTLTLEKYADIYETSAQNISGLLIRHGWDRERLHDADYVFNFLRKYGRHSPLRKRLSSPAYRLETNRMIRNALKNA
jgi:hypothetical protein